ncbi:hypothetical protein CcNV_019 [Crangon crangon nudivirus]|uniref:Uncharacterized protein n=1 Tax=Crangon crangon nudivirus TaxID=2880838 RepID=A0AAE8Y0S8_9VIRU|nr:hypothetical protein QKT25_gp019 [Crangon crangon nudivirus]UBZ25503.1 hypothetical protein CcNV_019 [Crangon crangon nudivirus]
MSWLTLLTITTWGVVLTYGAPIPLNLTLPELPLLEPSLPLNTTIVELLVLEQPPTLIEGLTTPPPVIVLNNSILPLPVLEQPPTLVEGITTLPPPVTVLENPILPLPGLIDYRVNEMAAYKELTEYIRKSRNDTLHFQQELKEHQMCLHYKYDILLFLLVPIALTLLIAVIGWINAKRTAHRYNVANNF